MNYANLHGYSDVYPYEVVRVISDKTVEVRAMQYAPDPNWKPEMIPGGFAAHCTNQSEQKWIITPNPDSITIRVRKRKNGTWHSAFGRHVFSDKPRYFYDYNF
jgi:hypothetical protein